MSETWFRARGFGLGPEITAVEVERETKEFVVIGGSRNRQIGHYESFFKTFAEAKAYFVGKATWRLSRAQEEVELAAKRLVECEAL